MKVLMVSCVIIMAGCATRPSNLPSEKFVDAVIRALDEDSINLSKEEKLEIYYELMGH